MRSSLNRRAGPLFGAGLTVVGLLASLAPLAPVASAVDPTPDPSASAIASTPPDPTPSPVVDPTPSATPSATDSPTPDPSLAPTQDPSPSPTPDASASPTPTPSDSAAPSDSASPSPTPTPATLGLRVEHYWVGVEDRTGLVVDTGLMDTPRTDLARFTVYRVRFQVLNGTNADVVVRPALYVAAGPNPSSTAWTQVPTINPVMDQPFYVASDDGETWEVRATTIAPMGLRLQASTDPAGNAVAGEFSAGENPAPSLKLAAHGFTEIEFAVRATVDAPWLSAWAFRLALGAKLAASADAVTAMGAAPPVILTPGQQVGEPVVEPEADAYPLNAPAGSVMAVFAVARPAVAWPAAGPAYPLGGPAAFTSPHNASDNSGMSGLAGDSCAACHSSHRAAGQYLLQGSFSPVSDTCLQCHDGTGALANVAAQFSDPSLPANDATTSSYYSHPATTAAATVGDFGGVLNRRAQCVDCHQPHAADGTKPVATAGGWTAGGPIAATAGVSVVNGPANSAPTYTLQTGSAYEYELCFKCHSGFTTLRSSDPAHPSGWALDKGVEFNPANLSYHPVEAAGTNTTAKMTTNLAGTSPYKLWTFTAASVIRCENCHGSSSAVSPAADDQIDNHASANRGILLRNYTDRVLKTSTAVYSAGDFALCYLCHAEAPMVDYGGNTRTDTNYRYHGFHVAGLGGNGSGGTDIDVAGAGQGNALCAECHFRIHGSSLPVNGQTPNSRLVNFAPDVQPYNGVLRYVPRNGATPGSCTLICHGKEHAGLVY